MSARKVNLKIQDIEDDVESGEIVGESLSEKFDALGQEIIADSYDILMRAKKKGMKEEAIIDLAIIAAVGGFLGAKILYIIVSLKEFLQNPLAVIGSEGFVVYGGIISGVLCCMLYCKVKKLNCPPKKQTGI